MMSSWILIPWWITGDNISWVGIPLSGEFMTSSPLMDSLGGEVYLLFSYLFLS